MSSPFGKSAPLGAGPLLRVALAGLIAFALGLGWRPPAHAQSDSVRSASSGTKKQASKPRPARATSSSSARKARDDTPDVRKASDRQGGRNVRSIRETRATRAARANRSTRASDDRNAPRRADRAAAARALGTAAAGAAGAGVQRVSAGPGNATSPAATGQPAEARLLDIYRHIGRGESKSALDKAEALVRDVPHFQLAQLVYGDLLLAQTRPLPAMGHAPSDLASKAPARLAQLKEEAGRRLAALRERPPTGTVPTQFIELPATTRHAIAVDASRSRLYLFENGPKGLQLVADHYASIGKLGSDKRVEGDQRTPLGVYFITSRLDASQLADFYGVGALTLNYPNEHDRRLGRTGSGIWLHGVPSDSYARSPQSTDGCVVLANPELQAIIERVQPRTTPVVIAQSLKWVPPAAKEPERRSLNNLLEGWRTARASGDLPRLLSFYSSQFAPGGKDIAQWRQAIERDMSQTRGKELQLKDVSILGWKDQSDVLVVTFGEVAEGQRTGTVKRQYWAKEGGLWKIFYEGVIG